MRLSKELIQRLQTLLTEQTGKNYTDEQAQEAGLAIMRFLLAKAQRQSQLTMNKETRNE